MKAQYHIQLRVPDANVKHWRDWYLVPALDQFQTELKANGWKADYAPEMPPVTDALEGFIRQPFRILFSWIPDWSPNRDAGHHVIRIDTCEKKAA